MTTNLTIEREIPPDERDRAIESLARLIRNYLPGTRLLVTVERKKRERSDLQNRALFGCAYKALRDQTGNDADDLHNYFCGEFFGWAKHIVMKKEKLRPVRTTTKDENGRRDVVSTVVMADFYDFVQRRSAENGYDVPDPDPEWWKQEKAA